MDHPVSIFPGEPLVTALRKKEALQEMFPGVSGQTLVRKKEMLDQKAAREKEERENPRPKPKKVVKPIREFTQEDIVKQKKLIRKIPAKLAKGKPVSEE